MPHKHDKEDAARTLTHGSSVATSDMASDHNRAVEDRTFTPPATRPIEPTPEGEKHDHMAAREASAEDRQEALLDEALEETFPGSDPISPKHIT